LVFLRDGKGRKRFSRRRRGKDEGSFGKEGKREGKNVEMFPFRILI
jgi:hypothetical protein